MPDPIWCMWFSGFVDGEGYFQISKSPNCGLALTVTLREDDKEIIDEIHNNLLGHIYYLSYKRDRVKGKSSCNQWAWKIRKISHIINIIIPIFELYPLRTKKRISYDIWKEAAWLLYNKNHLTETGQQRFFELHEELIDSHRSPFSERGYMVTSPKILYPVQYEFHP